MIGFEKRFESVIIEKDEEQKVAPTDAAAMQQELDPETNPADLGAQPPAPQAQAQVNKVVQAQRETAQAQLQELQTWIGQIDEFIEYLNGVNGNSLQSKLHAAGCDSLFEKIARSETKKIARVAVDLSSLSEALKGYLIAGSAEGAKAA
jgi:hypothetical protein